MSMEPGGSAESEGRAFERAAERLADTTFFGDLHLALAKVEHGQVLTASDRKTVGEAHRLVRELLEKDPTARALETDERTRRRGNDLFGAVGDVAGTHGRTEYLERLAGVLEAVSADDPADPGAVREARTLCMLVNRNRLERAQQEGRFTGPLQF